MQVKREPVLNALEMVRPGLSQKEIVEQSSCFLFEGSQLVTYNEDVSCRMKSPLNGFTGAVQAQPLLALLSKLAEEVVDISKQEGEMIVKGKGRRAGIIMEEKPLNHGRLVDKPLKWGRLKPIFQEALATVRQCASTDASQFNMSCVHVTPNYVEACDNFQAIRFRVKTPIKHPVLIQAESTIPVIESDPLEVAESKGQVWLHFRNASGLNLSLHAVETDEDYPDLSQPLKIRGEKCVLPKGLAAAVQKAHIFSVENPEHNQVRIQLKTNTLRIRGEGANGWYQETKQMEYSGKPMSFLIPPKILEDLSEKHIQCELSDRYLRVQTENYVYTTAIGMDIK